ncbi:MAG: hypothetical protein WCH84_04495 [Verrucomicrobiota bacterium]
MQIANETIQQEIAATFNNGLRLRYGDVLGSLYSEVVRYRAGNFMDIDELRTELDTEAVPVLRDILNNKVQPPTLHAIRSLMIGCAITGDRDAVLRWATAGLNRARQFGGEWAATVPQWESVQNDPGRFILYARQLKYFLQQL